MTPDRVRTSRENAELRIYSHVSSSSRLVCTGESHGSFNYNFANQVYPSDRHTIPVENSFGSIDYLPNPNFHPER